MRKLNKQVTVKVPIEVYRRARAEAAEVRRTEDGRKLLMSAVLRRWMLRGMEATDVATK